MENNTFVMQFKEYINSSFPNQQSDYRIIKI